MVKANMYRVFAAVLEFFRETEPTAYTDLCKRRFVIGISSRCHRGQKVPQFAVYKLENQKAGSIIQSTF